MRSVGFDFLLEEETPTRASQRALRHLMMGLKSGDVAMVCSLETLQMPSGEIIVLLQRFYSAGIKLLLVDAIGSEDITASPTPRLLGLLARNEQHWPTRVSLTGRSPRTRKLSAYQVRYARELRRRGESLRAIGLLFQTAPNDLLSMMDGDPISQEASQSAPSESPLPTAAPRLRAFLTQGDLGNQAASTLPSKERATEVR